MYKLVIEDTEYSIPEGLTVKQWMQVMNLNPESDSYLRDLVKVVLDIPEDEVKLILDSTIDLVASFVAIKLNHYVESKDAIKTKDFTKMSFGEFIDLDVYLDMGINKSMDKICELVFDDYNDETLICQISDGISRVIGYRTYLFNQYSGLFSAPQIEEDEPKIKPSLVKSWYSVTASLVEEDITKFDEILAYPVIKVFNFMSYRKEQTIKKLKENR